MHLKKINKLEIVQNCAIKIITGVLKSTPIEAIRICTQFVLNQMDKWKKT